MIFRIELVEWLACLVKERRRTKMLNAVQLPMFLVQQSPVVDLVGSDCAAFALLAGGELQISTHRIGAIGGIAIAGRQLSTIFSLKKRPW
jgi:hypothetical protein